MLVLPLTSMWKTRRREGGKMEKFMVHRDDYPTYYQYRKAIKEYRKQGYIIHVVCGGVMCFESWADYGLWKNQK